MGGVVDYTEKYSNDSEVLDMWIANCLIDPQPCTYYCKSIVVTPACENKVIPRDDVIIPQKEEKLNYEKTEVEFDHVFVLEETQLFVEKFLGTRNTKKINVSHPCVYGVTKPEFVSKSLNPK